MTTNPLKKFNQKYNVIYIDSPWKFITFSPKGKLKKSAENHYDTMGIHEIYGLDIQRIADPTGCVIFSWVTFPLLEHGLEAISQWGFTYKTNAFTWVKRNKVADSWFWGTGYWTRANAELCLLATIGKPKRFSRSVHQILDDRVMRHSKKPEEARKRIVELCGDVPRIELFAREQAPGWEATGLELDGIDIRKGLGLTIHTKETFVSMVDEEIQKIKDRGGRSYMNFSLNFGSNYKYETDRVVEYYRNQGYDIIIHICKKKLVDVTIIWSPE